MSHKTYVQIRPALKTGDIVLFSGVDPVSTIIRGLSRSLWSHVGMVVVWDEWDTVLLWESTPKAKAVDIDTGKMHHGVNLVPLSYRISSWLENKKNKVAVRHLDAAIDDDMQKKLAGARAELSGKPYDMDLIEIINANRDSGLWSENQEDLSAIFCSELVAEAYQRMGLLSEHKPSNEYTPKDFSTEQTQINQFQLLQRQLSNEIFIGAGS